MTAVKGFRPEINFQDLGGYTAIDGRAVRNGLLYRSSAPGLMNEEELNLLRDMSIHTMMDFRSRKDVKSFPIPNWKDTSGSRCVPHSKV
ncbi:MAG: tyrosine-protein phosphatase [Solobacterium sp.]|nr:tyrosine-protein phosphatase [Solobacterium sp.]